MWNGQPDLLQGMPEEQADQALSLGTRLTVRSGEVLFALGDKADRIFIITRGQIRLTLPMHVRDKDEDVTVEERSSGQTIGWSALIPPYRFTLKATATVETEVIALSRDDLRRLFETQPEIGYTVTRNLAAVIGQRLQVFQAMWLREMQRTVELCCR